MTARRPLALQLGPDHPDTLRTLGNLASCRVDTGDFAGAIKDYEQLLAARIRTLGPDHEDTLRTLGDLIYTHSQQDSKP
ncbi:tetratricopeptide repeat protein [Nocardia arthritidis]|uniref:tetratricopeptide repeat protein n=1 Tax=Nocardia arthritidis TaxID=228602 RepID=UPI0023B0A189|nr:tetratricopeptide repeat protein [Nocardia arthritidis]